MKKHYLILSVLFIAMTSLAKENKLSVSMNTMSMDYTEFNSDGSFADSEKADALVGFTLNYSTQIRKRENSFLNIDFSRYQGNTRYDGFYIDAFGNITGPANNLTTINTITDSSISYYETKKSNQLAWFARFGIGHRLWVRDLSGSHTEKYDWSYAAISTGINWNIVPSNTIGVSAEYHKAFSPTMKSNQHGTFNLGNTDGYNISIPWTYTITPSWAIKLAYTYQTWNIEHSTVHSDGWYEPRSESNFNLFNTALIYTY